MSILRNGRVAMLNLGVKGHSIWGFGRPYLPRLYIYILKVGIGGHLAMSNKRAPLHNLPQLPILNSRVFNLAKGGEKGAHFIANVFLFSNDQKVSIRNRKPYYFFKRVFHSLYLMIDIIWK